MAYLKIRNRVATILAYLYKYCIIIGVDRNAYIRFLLIIFLRKYYKNIMFKDRNCKSYTFYIFIDKGIKVYLENKRDDYLEILLDNIIKVIKILDKKTIILFYIV